MSLNHNKKTEHALCCNKTCATAVVSKEQNDKLINISWELFNCLNDDENLLKNIITGMRCRYGMGWYSYDTETKEQSLQ